jgi:hypothetical protein
MKEVVIIKEHLDNQMNQNEPVSQGTLRNSQ